MRDVAKLIIDSIVENYYKEPTSDPLTSFEVALKKTNEKLAALAEEGEVGWVGKTKLTPRLRSTLWNWSTYDIVAPAGAERSAPVDGGIYDVQDDRCHCPGREG